MPFARVVLSVMAGSLLALPATASLVEEATGGVVTYQFDGPSFRDAPDACPEAGTEWSLPWAGGTDGVLVPADDLADSFVLDVPEDAVGDRLEVTLVEGGPRLEFTAYAPGCLGTVFDPLNLPRPPPSPPAPAEGEQQYAGTGLDDPWHCTDEGWMFVADRVGDPAPASIHVAWTDGSERTVPLRYEPGPHAVYATAENVGITLKGAWINVHAGWTGSLRLAAGPCDAVDGGAVYGDPPSLSGGALAFTPVRSGPYVVVVSLADVPAGPSLPAGVIGGLVGPLLQPVHDLAHDLLHALLADPGHPPSLSAPASCHDCVAGLQQTVEKVSYFLRSGNA